MVDESLEEFLGSLDKTPEFIHGTYNTNVNRKYDGSCSDLNILTLDDTHEGGYAPFVPSTSLLCIFSLQFFELHLFLPPKGKKKKLKQRQFLYVLTPSGGS